MWKLAVTQRLLSDGKVCVCWVGRGNDVIWWADIDIYHGKYWLAGSLIGYFLWQRSAAEILMPTGVRLSVSATATTSCKQFGSCGYSRIINHGRAAVWWSGQLPIRRWLCLLSVAKLPPYTSCRAVTTETLRRLAAKSNRRLSTNQDQELSRDLHNACCVRHNKKLFIKTLLYVKEEKPRTGCESVS